MKPLRKWNSSALFCLQNIFIYLRLSFAPVTIKNPLFVVLSSLILLLEQALMTMQSYTSLQWDWSNF